MRREAAELNPILAYSFKDESLLNDALTHRSVSKRNNERLEFLGDSILNFVVAADLYRRYPESSEGELSRIRASLVNKETLAALGQSLGLGDFLILGSGELKSGGFRRKSILADTVEAIFGAVYLDSGLVEAEALILRVYKDYLSNPIDIGSLKDPKTRLQEFLQSERRELPVYDLVEVTGKSHAQTFKVVCRIAGIEEEAYGVGSSRRKAEQAAAAMALDNLMQETV